MTLPILEASLIEQLQNVYTKHEAHEWIVSPQYLLGGKTPREMIDAGMCEEVILLVNQISGADENING